MQFENIFKSWVTTIIGLVIMGLAVYWYAMDYLTEWPALGVLSVGFILMWMRDKLSEKLGAVLDAAIERIKGSK